MIGTEDMSTSTGMDISESFRAEDLSKTDFFDFVTSPDLGIGIGVGVDVGVSLHHHQQQQPHQHHPQHSQHHHQHQQQQQQLSSHSHQQQHHGSERLSAGNMTHDGGGSAGDSRNGSSASSNSDPTLQGYEFWQADKHPDSRLDSNSIFEDLDRYCWQQQPATATATSTVQSTSTHSQSHPAQTSPRHQQQQQQQQHQQHQAKATGNVNSSTSSSTASVGGSGSISQPGSAGTVSSIDNTDGQIYTLTVLNGNEPSWLKRTEANDHQLPGTLDLDSLLGSFPGYIKSEYPYDDSGFSTDGTKDANGGGGGSGGNDVTVTSNGISIPHVDLSHHCGNGGGGSSQTLPSLVTAISIAGGGNVTDVASLNLGQHLAQFQNNNNDWHMADHNTVEQNTAESLLRSALQGKGYAKGLQSMQNGITLLPPVSSPSVKEDDMRRMLFTPDADSLNFADSTLNAAQIFDDTQSMSHAGHLLVPHSPTTPNAVSAHNNNNNNAMPSIIVDDMFLSLENAFSDDFEKIKRIANEVQQFCAATTPTSVDYNVSDVMMQISPATAASTASSSTTPQLQQLHSPATTPTGQVTVMHLQQQQQQQQQQANLAQATQAHKPEVSTSTASPSSGTSRLTGVTKPKKQYKRNTSVNNTTNNNNNNNPNVINHNVNGSIAPNTSNPNGSSNSNSSSNSPPTSCNAGNSSNINSTAATANSGSGSGSGGGSGSSQRKERSLHYCSICSKGFKDKYSVNVHIRTHTGEKPFACSLCGKSFRQKAHLAKHYQTHMTQKNNGNLVKGSAAKHPRSAGVTGSSASSPTVAQQRQLAAVAAASLPSVGQGLALSASGNVTALSAGVVLNGPNAGVGGSGVGVGVGVGGLIPPPNGLLTNR